MANRNNRKQNWQRGALIGVCVFLSLTLALLIAGTVLWESKLNLVNYVPEGPSLSEDEIQDILKETDAQDPDFTGPVLGNDEIQWNENDTTISNSENVINILLIGQDKREGQGRQRSDAMILVTVNKSAKTITMTSFLRDMYVKIPGYAASKLTNCYAIGGMKLLNKTLEQNFGIQIDGNVEVDFNGFMKVIDLLGGVEITLTQEEATFLNNNGNWDVVESEENWNLTEGKNVLTGSQALAYARIRYIGMDFERTERQRKVLTALFDKVQDMSLLELNGLLDQILPLITTDLQKNQITGYVLELAPLLLDIRLQTQRVPADDTWYFAKVDGTSVIIVDFEKNRAMLEQTIGG